MLTAHQRLLIRNHLPEVEHVDVREQETLDIRWIRLELYDGSTIAIYGFEDSENRCRWMRPRTDYSDRSEILLIPAEMQARLVSIFGQLRFDGG